MILKYIFVKLDKVFKANTRSIILKEQYEYNTFKTIALTWNYEFKLHDALYSVSDIHDYLDLSIKNHKTLTTNPLIYLYINRINNRLVFKIKDIYKLELQTLELLNYWVVQKNC